MTKNKTSCKARWNTNKNDRIRELRKLFRAYQSGDDAINAYGLAFDYVAPRTFTDQLEGYWRYQLSWGGPSDEFRFYASGHGEHTPHRISYVFLDWFDGHERTLAGRDVEFMRDIWGFFASTGLTESEYRKGSDYDC